MFQMTSAPVPPKVAAGDLTCEDIASMPPHVFGAMSPPELGSLTANATYGIQPTHISVLSLDQLAAIKHSELSMSAFSGWKPEQVSVLSLETIGDMDSITLKSIGVPTLRAYSDPQLQAISLSAMVSGFSKDRLIDLHDRISAFKPVQMLMIPDDCFPIAISQMEYLKPEVCAVLSMSQLSKLSAEHFRAMSLPGISALTMDQFSSLQMPQRSQFTADQIGALKPAIMHKYGYEN